MDIDKDMLAQMMAGGNTSLPTMEQIFQQATEANPQLQPLVQLMLQQRAQAAQGQSPVTEENVATIEQIRKEQEELQVLTRKMFKELEILRARNDALAAALGACHLCWGNDPQCQYCEGNGGVGGILVDRRLFSQWVDPAIRQVVERRRQFFRK